MARATQLVCPMLSAVLITRYTGGGGLRGSGAVARATQLVCPMLSAVLITRYTGVESLQV